MNRKLTLSLDPKIIDFAHDFSKKSNQPISKIVENYFLELKNKNTSKYAKEVEDLYGILEGVEIPDKKEMRKTFYEKNIN
jgi:hypothetical protein